MTRRQTRVGLRPEESIVREALRHVYPDASVTVHDDGSQWGMYDLRLSGPFDAAVEVGRVTDPATRQAFDHWQKDLTSYRTPELRWLWLFIFSDRSTPGGPARFPWLERPRPAELVSVLRRLEARDIRRTGRWLDHAVQEHGGLSIADPDIDSLFRLLGPTGELASASDPGDEDGEEGGWLFAFGHGAVSTTDPNRFAKRVEVILRDDGLRDMRDKLARAGLPVRMAALVFDSFTDDGYATRHVAGSTEQMEPIRLPQQITHVVIVGLDDLTLLFSATDGWSRHYAPRVT